MTLIEQYDAAVLCAEIQDDPAQREVLQHLQRIVDELAPTKPSWFGWKRKKSVQGLYLYGPVGVGKTYLMDLFYQTVEEPRKARFHFHHFMQQVDAQLRRLQGQKDPIQRIAAQLAKTTRLLCFDEFLVHDVADAMILATLLEAILAHDVVLVGTSNTAPDSLYLGGVQRARFLPAIELIKHHCQVWALGDRNDYRLGRTPLPQAYLYPLNGAAEQALSEQFSAIEGDVTLGPSLTIQNRQVACVRSGKRAVWFQFDMICNLPRSQLDYLEIADRFDSVFVSGIPILTSNDTIRAILLIHFIDVMYDRGIRLVISAEGPLENLYLKGDMVGEFQRTLSRLKEMQSQDYLHRHQRRSTQQF